MDGLRSSADNSDALITAMSCAYLREGFIGERELSTVEAVGLGMLLAECSRQQFRYYDHVMAITILRDIERVGDCRFAKQLEYLCARQSDFHELIANVAREVLPPLKEKWERLQRGSGLLRAATPPDGDIDMLVRPLTAADSAGEKRLLRSATRASDEDKN